METNAMRVTGRGGDVGGAVGIFDDAVRDRIEGGKGDLRVLYNEVVGVAGAYGRRILKVEGEGGRWYEGMTGLEFAIDITVGMGTPPSGVYPAGVKEGDVWVPKPDSQTFSRVLGAAADEEEKGKSKEVAKIIRKIAEQREGFQFEGRFLNAYLRCWRDDVDGVIREWKEIRKLNLIQLNSGAEVKGSHGLIWCCGVGRRPDVALKVVYAMQKEGRTVGDICLNVYKRGREEGGNVEARWGSIKAYEDLLEVECEQFRDEDWKKKGDKKIRILL